MSELVGGRAKTRNGFLILHKLTHRERIAEISKVKSLLIKNGYTYRSSLINDGVAAAAVKSLQSCPTLCDPTDGSPPGSPIPGFSRQEHWSGLPFPSPMHESEK